MKAAIRRQLSTFGNEQTGFRTWRSLPSVMNPPPDRPRTLRYAVMLICAGITGGLSLPARGGPFEVPELSNPATGVRLVGKLVWLDLETTDLAGAKRFYRALFGWDYRDYQSSGVDYTVALADARPIAGFVRRQILNDTERRSAWLPFFSTADVGSTFARALEARAQVRSEPETLPLRGRQARLTDPEGAVFALLNSSSGDPADDPNPRAYGTWGAPSLLARDPASEAVFYQTLFGYAMLGAPTDQGFERIRLSNDTVERADVRRLPDGMHARQPRWIGVARVFSAADTARRAVSLGGRIILSPTPSTQGGTLTILEDPTGAAFGVLELPPAVVSLGKQAPLSPRE